MGNLKPLYKEIGKYDIKSSGLNAMRVKANLIVRSMNPELIVIFAMLGSWKVYCPNILIRVT